jgi:hypothetical protein
MSDYKTKGTLSEILPVEEGTSKAGKAWKKVVFVVKNNDGHEGREQIYAFGIFGDEKVDKFLKYNEENVGSEVEVSFNINTNQWGEKYYTSLDAWRVDSGEKVEQSTYVPNISGEAKPEPEKVDDLDDAEDDLPF